MGGAKKPGRQQQNKQAAANAGSKAAKGQAGKGKKQREPADLRDPLDRQLALLGLRVKNITADGNCFFRALSDQLQGDEGRHSQLRAEVCSLMADQPDAFAPFVEDDQTLDSYLSRMRREGVWAGHMELQAASLVLQSNIAIYQAGQPRWCITNFPPGSRMLHLSYHDGEHYNSVRRGDDYSRGSPADIPEHLAPVADVAQAQECWSAADERRVAEGTGCGNPVWIRQQLQKAGGDVAAAIEAVIEVMAGDDYEPVDSSTVAAAGADADADVDAVVEVDTGAAAAAGEEAGAEQVASSSRAGEGSQDQTEVQQPKSAAANEVEGQGEGTEGQQPHHQQQQQPGVELPRASSTGQQSVQAAESEGSSAAGGEAAAAADSKAGGSKPTSSGGSKKAKGVKLKTGSSSGVAVRRGGGGAEKVSRNKPCPCGSGRKHKVCCEGKEKKGGGGGGKAGGEGLPAALATLHI